MQRDFFPSYKCAVDNKDNVEWIHLQNEILRSEWGGFLPAAGMDDLRRIFQYFARQDGRAPPDYRPPRLAPLRVNNEYTVGAHEKAEALAEFFASKLAKEGVVTQQKDNQVRDTLRGQFRSGSRKLAPPSRKGRCTWQCRMPRNEKQQAWTGCRRRDTRSCRIYTD